MDSFYAIWNMPGKGWACLLFLSLAIYVVGQSLNIIVIRKLSATLLTSLSSIRLVVSCAASYVLLQEPIVNKLQWFGIIIVIVSILFYVRVQVESTSESSTKPTQVEVAEVIEDTEGDNKVCGSNGIEMLKPSKG